MCTPIDSPPPCLAALPLNIKTRMVNELSTYYAYGCSPRGGHWCSWLHCRLASTTATRSAAARSPRTAEHSTAWRRTALPVKTAQVGSTPTETPTPRCVSELPHISWMVARPCCTGTTTGVARNGTWALVTRSRPAAAVRLTSFRFRYPVPKVIPRRHRAIVLVAISMVGTGGRCTAATTAALTAASA